MPLNDTAIRKAKSGKKPVKLSDGGGLYLLIQPHGTKLWRISDTSTIASPQRT
jgi:hypothetical protein